MYERKQQTMSNQPRPKQRTVLSMRYVLVFWLFVLSAVAYLDRTNISIAKRDVLGRSPDRHRHSVNGVPMPPASDFPSEGLTGL